jgi:hypothetical protein
VDPTAEEEEQRRRLRSVVAVTEPLPYTGAAAMVCIHIHQSFLYE